MKRFYDYLIDAGPLHAIAWILLAYAIVKTIINY